MGFTYSLEGLNPSVDAINHIINDRYKDIELSTQLKYTHIHTNTLIYTNINSRLGTSMFIWSTALKVDIILDS